MYEREWKSVQTIKNELKLNELNENEWKSMKKKLIKNSKNQWKHKILKINENELE